MCWVVTFVFSDCLKLLLLSAASRVPDCQTCNREGPTTESAEPVTWYSHVMSSGWPDEWLESRLRQSCELPSYWEHDACHADPSNIQTCRRHIVAQNDALSLIQTGHEVNLGMRQRTQKIRQKKTHKWHLFCGTVYNTRSHIKTKVGMRVPPGRSSSSVSAVNYHIKTKGGMRVPPGRSSSSVSAIN